jgi:diadenosine tetraphosphatase ApaH/serine/threonine PP2A family protein phosphatase
LIAFFGDIHANLPAFEACLSDAEDHGATRFVFLGDYVGYGAHPVEVLEQVMGLVERGSVAVRGNHDDMAADFDREMNPLAASAAKWTRNQLQPQHLAFLETLPLTYRDKDRLYVHADASAPERWRYVHSVESAALSLSGTDARIVLCGHVHSQAVYGQAGAGQIAKFTPSGDAPVPLLTSRRWHIVLGSVGQPRDGVPLASYALFDEARCEISFRRVAYDVEAAARAILAAGLPSGLAERLKVGR